MASNLNVTELDFDQIKENLKSFMKSQSQFKDYDFDGSGLNVLMDVLAYNTHYNAMLAHFALNEAFLDSAQIRGNVVSRAGLLGYTPRSVLAPRAIVKLVVDVSAYQGTIPSVLVIERGTKFNSVVDGVAYTFSSLQSQTAILVEEGSTKTYTFDEVEELLQKNHSIDIIFKPINTTYEYHKPKMNNNIFKHIKKKNIKKII